MSVTMPVMVMSGLLSGGGQPGVAPLGDGLQGSDLNRPLAAIVRLGRAGVNGTTKKNPPAWIFVVAANGHVEGLPRGGPCQETRLAWVQRPSSSAGLLPALWWASTVE